MKYEIKRYKKWYDEVNRYYKCDFSEMMEIIESNGIEFLYDLMRYFETIED